MADARHLAVLAQGAAAWNAWRLANPQVRPDLAGADLQDRDLAGAFLAHADLAGAALAGANLHEAKLTRADLAGADLTEANLHRSILSGATLTGARLVSAHLAEAALNGTALERARLEHCNLRGAQVTSSRLDGAVLREARLSNVDFTLSRLPGADLTGANLSNSRLIDVDLDGAVLDGADLTTASLVNASLRGASLRHCWVFGINAWRLELEGAQQQDLIITPFTDSPLTVDDIEVAQFIYLLIDNRKIRTVIDTLATRAVLILGRFSAERKPVLEALRAPLRERGLMPVIFDFEKPATRNLLETVTTLARLSKFVVADITDPRSVPQELVSIVQTTPSVPVLPLLHRDAEPWSMFESITPFPWVRPLLRYTTPETAAAALAALLDAQAPGAPTPPPA